jgi:hypothetical protein
VIGVPRELRDRGITRSIVRQVLISCCCVSPLSIAAGPAAGRIAAEEYPDWFLRMPAIAGVRTAVGYAPLSGDTAASIAEAREHGRNTLRIASAVRVRAEFLQEVLTDGYVAYRGERYDEDTLAAPIDSVVALDTVLRKRMVLVLVATRSVPGFRSRPASVSSRLPAWVTTTPASEARGVAYAVGGAEAHFNEEEAWVEAERQARRGLAYATATRLQSGAESRTGGTSNGALIATTSTELHDIVVRERWRDARRLFVLVHARTGATGGT